MIKGDYKKLDEIAEHNQCAEHKKPLVVAWHSEENSYALRCGEGHYPDAVNRIISFSQEVKHGKHEDVVKAVKVRQQHEAKEKGGSNLPTAVTFPGVPATDLATGELLPVDLIKNLVAYAVGYGLDPVRSHVVIMYGKPYITIDGYLFHANRSKIAYSLNSRPMTADEEKQYKVGPIDIAWLARIIKLATGEEFTGLGIVTEAEIIEESTRKPGVLRSPVVAKHPQLLAQKRAEWQALRRAFPIGETGEEKED